jgi:HAD superfamily hydrolase (TIGR01549 family)
MTPKVLTLDLDDTLWDAGPALEAAERELYAWLANHYPRTVAQLSLPEMIAKRRHFAVSRSDIAHDFGKLRHAFLSLLAEEAGYSTSLADDGLSVFVQVRSTVRLFADTKPALAALANAYRLVALSNGNADLGIAGLGHYFEMTLSPAELDAAKPDPAVFETVMSLCSVSRDDIVHVGDDPFYDIAAAQMANVRAVWVNRTGASWSYEHVPPHAEIRSLSELGQALESLTKN